VYFSAVVRAQDTQIMKKVYTTGRPPWYDSKGIKCPLVIGVAGMMVSAKSFLFSNMPLYQVEVQVVRQVYAGMTMS
jgi:hypothetical protein